ncbi:MAG: hypothetical protein ACOYKZ_02310, partial [Chlamydiia bacterium]
GPLARVGISSALADREKSMNPSTLPVATNPVPGATDVTVGQPGQTLILEGHFALTGDYTLGADNIIVIGSIQPPHNLTIAEGSKAYFVGTNTPYTCGSVLCLAERAQLVFLGATLRAQDVYQEKFSDLTFTSLEGQVCQARFRNLLQDVFTISQSSVDGLMGSSPDVDTQRACEWIHAFGSAHDWSNCGAMPMANLVEEPAEPVQATVAPSNNAQALESQAP